jgi:aminoglycoside phosphotransferase (APT) family kinase protein
MTVAAGILTRAARPLPPVDLALPALGLLDSELLTKALRATLPPRHEVESARVRYLEYRPQLRLLMHADVLVDGTRRDASLRAGTAATPVRAATGHKVPWVESVVHWMPSDPDLPLLAATRPELCTLLAQAGARSPAADEPALLAYVPSRRAVLRIGDCVLKTYARVEDFRRSAAALALVGDGLDLPTPRFVAAVPELRTTVQEAVDGLAAAPDAAVDLAPSAGLILRRLHRSDRQATTVMSPHAQLAVAADAVTLLGSVVPEQRDRARALLRHLHATAPSDVPLVLSHGDFNIGQLLTTVQGTVVTDVDMVCRAPAAYDLASYAANLVSGRPGDELRAEAALEALLSTYGDVPALRWHLATALLRRCDRPFRRAKRRWIEHCTTVLDIAERVSESWGE